MAVLLSGLSLGIALHARAGEESLGALFLDEPTGARATAMGEAMVAPADDANAVFWNPAALARIARRELLLAHAQSYQGFRNEYAALAWPWTASDALGFNLFFSYADGFEKFSESGDAAGSYSLYDLYAGVSWSHIFNPQFSGGVTVKGLRQGVDTYAGTSAAADLSVLWAGALPNLNLGLIVKNLGKPMVFIQQSHPLNAAVEAGAAYALLDKALLVTFDLRKPFAQEMVFKLGSEYNFQDMIFLRGGYRYAQYGNDLGPLSGLSLGLGVRISDYNLDYAYSPFPDLGDVHRFTVTLPFGRSVVEEQRILEKLEKQVKAKQRAIFDQTVSEGDRLAAQNAPEKALAAYNKAYGMNPTDSSLSRKIAAMEQTMKKAAVVRHTARGQKAMKDKDYLTALVEWSKVLELDPNDTTAQTMIASANLNLSNQKLSASTDKNSGIIDQYFHQGLQALQAGRYAAALDMWKKILNLDPNNTRVAQYLRLTQSKLEDVIEELLTLADQEWENERYAAAAKKWRQILDLAGTQGQAQARLAANRAKLAELADFNYKLGVQLYIQNDLDAALAAWQNVLIFEPDNAKALQHVDQVKRKRKELEALK